MSIYQFKAKNYKNEDVDLSTYKGKVLLIVNTASKCGFTPQYAELEELYKKYSDNFEILAFPCNQFGGQEPGNASEIKEFCDLQFNISFDLFDKIEVNGKDTHALYQYLKKQAKGIMGSEKVKWNFTKFLVDKEGNVIKRYAPQTKPLSISTDIEELL